MLRYITVVLLTYIGGLSTAAALGPLRVDEISPTSGATTPGLTVTVSGNGFAPGTKAYFDGLMARQTVFVDSGRLEVVTPYLRPGKHDIYVKTGGNLAKLAGAFAALPTIIDSKIDAAITQAGLGQFPAALRLLDEAIAGTDDNQVKSFAHYYKGQLFYAQGDFVRWDVETALIYDRAWPAGMAVQTYWPYVLAFARTVYLLLTQPVNEPWFLDDFSAFDLAVQCDVTGNPEPRFYRGLLCARTGNISTAKADSDFCLKADPKNSSYLALVAFVSAASGDPRRAILLSERARNSLNSQSPTDVRAVSLLGETAYLAGDLDKARQDWAMSAHGDPLQAQTALMLGRKHLKHGEQQVAAMLLSECMASSPSAEMAGEAGSMLEGIPSAQQGVAAK